MGVAFNMKHRAAPGKTGSGCFPERERAAGVLKEASASRGGVGELPSCILFLLLPYT